MTTAKVNPPTPIRPRLTTALGLLLIIAACSSSTDSTPSTTTPLSIETTTSTTTTSTTAATTTSTEAATTSSAAPQDDGLIGTQEAYDTLVDQVIGEAQFWSIVDDIPAEDIPLPDLRDPDPVQALQEIFSFEAWVFENAPVPPWANLIAVRGDAYWVSSSRNLDSMAIQRWRAEVVGQPWTWVSGEDFGKDFDLTGTGLEDPGISGTRLVSFETMRGEHRMLDWDTNEIRELRPGWHFEGMALIAPTDIGWQLVEFVFEEAP